MLRVSVWERGQEVAFETCVLGALRRGYRCLEMRSRLGTIYIGDIGVINVRDVPIAVVYIMYDLSTLMRRYDIRIHVVE